MTSLERDQSKTRFLQVSETVVKITNHGSVGVRSMDMAEWGRTWICICN